MTGKRDVQTIYRLLGVSASATPAEAEAAAQRWGLENPRPLASGLQVLSATSSKTIRPAISATAFNGAVAVRRQLFDAIPAVEAFYADNQTYSGSTVARLRRIDAKLSGSLSIVRATSAKYRVELTGFSLTWSYAGPGGAPTFGRCPR